jgi:hypothetical protein
MSVKIFFCYAHEDEPLLNKLKTHLRPLQREGLIDLWHDRDISAGTEWEQEISQQLKTAQIILLLVSPDFMDSDYCYGIEMKQAIERHERGEAHVIPIILRPVYWQIASLRELQALPVDAKPVVDRYWHSPDEAFFNVTEGIRKVVEKVTAQPSSATAFGLSAQVQSGEVMSRANAPVGKTKEQWLDEAEAHEEAEQYEEAPYNLRVSEEITLYEKLFKQSTLQNVHIAPHTLRISSIFAVLTRLHPSKKSGMSLMKKLRLYDGEDFEDFKQKDIKELQDEAVREGMDGISPRYVINCLSNALIRPNVTCINPTDALQALYEGFYRDNSLTRKERERYLECINIARNEYDEIATKEVVWAFVFFYEESVRTLLNNYLDNVEAYCNKTKLRDPITDEEMEPDELLMRSIEEQIGITENAKDSFRQEVLIRISSLARRGVAFDYTSHERLKEAIEKKLFGDLRDVVKITTSARTPDKEQLRKINEVVNRLMNERGYCHICANEILRHVGSLLNR